MTDIQISPHPHLEEVFTPEATDFIVDLVRTFRDRRNEILADRIERQERISAGERPDFLKETAGNSFWRLENFTRASTTDGQKS